MEVIELKRIAKEKSTLDTETYKTIAQLAVMFGWNPSEFTNYDNLVYGFQIDNQYYKGFVFMNYSGKDKHDIYITDEKYVIIDILFNQHAGALMESIDTVIKHPEPLLY